MCGDGSALPLVRTLAQQMGEELEVCISPTFNLLGRHLILYACSLTYICMQCESTSAMLLVVVSFLVRRH